MHSCVLTIETVRRIERVLALHGPQSPRDFERRFWVFRGELEEAAELGLVEYVVRTPPVGRPATLVPKSVNKRTATELLPHTWEVPKWLSCRHHRFILKLSLATPLVRAYYMAGYRPRSYAAARAAASRLAKRHHIKAGLRYIQRCGSFFCTFPTDLTLHGGGPWLALIQRFSIDATNHQRCRLAACGNLEEAKTLLPLPSSHS